MVAATPAYAHSIDEELEGLGSTAKPLAAVSDTAGNVFVLNEGDSTISTFSSGFVLGRRVLATLDPSCKPQGLTAVPSGDVYVSCAGSGSVSRVTWEGSVTAHVSNNGPASHPLGITSDRLGNVYVANYGSSTITKISASGAVVPVFARLNPADHPVGITTDSAGDIYVTESQTNRISKITASGVVNEAFAVLPTGDEAASFPVSVAVDPWGAVYSANASGSVTKFAADGSIAVAAMPLTPGDHLPTSVIVDRFGDVFVGDEVSHSVTAIEADGSSAEAVGGLVPDSNLRAFAVSGDSLIVADYASGRVTRADFRPLHTPETFGETAEVGVPVNLDTRHFEFTVGGLFVKSVVTEGELPPGLTIDASTGFISGTPTTAGTYSFELTFLNHWGASDSSNETITVG